MDWFWQIRRILAAAFFAVACVVFTACGNDASSVTPTPTVSITQNSTVTPRPTPSATTFATRTSTVTLSPTLSATATATGTSTVTPQPTSTPTLSPIPAAEVDAYFGWRGISTRASGRFRTEQINGVWWLVTPEGNAYFSSGVNHVTSEGDYAPALGRSPYQDNLLARYGTTQAWSDAVVDRFERLGLTTIGAWSEYSLFAHRVPYTEILGFAGRAPAVPGLSAGVTGLRIRDYFDPSFESGAAVEADGARSCVADPYCIGVFSDNELGWGVSIVQAVPYLDAYVRLPSGAPGKLALQQFFNDWYHGDLAAFNADWEQQLASFDAVQALTTLPHSSTNEPTAQAAARRAFTVRIAQRYYSVVYAALRAVSPDLLILGSRFLAYTTLPEIAQIAGSYVDVLSVNQYEVPSDILAILRGSYGRYGYVATGDLFADLDELYRLSNKPLLISETGFRAKDSGLPNTYPPFFPVYRTQTDRANGYARYMEHVFARSYLVGVHWFEYVDQPAQGRFDGENNNWGIVDINDNEYTEVAQRIEAMNSSRFARPR
ncbi:MAG: hypothetical protein HY270_17630 [Deltaproteobacteria bacterium]|nr:hypothetical protein [Deltaproteobacteria bacterium]